MSRKDVKVSDSVEATAWEDGTHWVTISYPRQSNFKKLGVFLSDVRAANGLWIHFDFEQNKWIVEEDKED